MPTRREREYYAAGYRDGLREARRDIGRDFGIHDMPIDFGPDPRRPNDPQEET